MKEDRPFSRDWERFWEVELAGEEYRARVSPRASTNGQAREISARGLTSDEDRTNLSAKLVNMLTRALPSNPLRVTARGGELSIKTHRPLKAHPRETNTHSLQERRVESLTLALQDLFMDHNSRST